jgi:acyl dehydratase
MPLNRECLGKKYPADKEFEVLHEMTRKYAEGTNDYNIRYLSKEAPVAPPMFAVVFQALAMGKAIFDPDLKADLARLVHGEQDMTFTKPVKPGDKITSEAEVVGMEDKGEAGEVLAIAVTSKNQDGDDVAKSVYSFFIRGKKKAEVKAEEKKKAVEEIPTPIFTHVVKVKPNQSLIYGDASGDKNPIHTSDDFAKAVGLPEMILQGLCTMAFCQKAVINEVLDGEPERLKRLKVRFSHIVLNGDVLTVKGWVQETSRQKSVIGFVAENQNGALVITNGLAEIS